MTRSIAINLAVEDPLSEATLLRIVKESGAAFSVAHCFQRGGFGYLKKQALSFNAASRLTPFLLLTDLDTMVCPAALIASWLPVPQHPNFLFRVSVRAVESWLIADRAGIAGFLGVSSTLVPRDPESLSDPKRELIRLASRSRRRNLREAIVPAPETTARFGPDYNGCLIRFVAEFWDPLVARKAAPSLDRTLSRLSEFHPQRTSH